MHSSAQEVVGPQEVTQNPQAWPALDDMEAHRGQLSVARALVLVVEAEFYPLESGPWPAILLFEQGVETSIRGRQGLPDMRYGSRFGFHCGSRYGSHSGRPLAAAHSHLVGGSLVRSHLRIQARTHLLLGHGYLHHLTFEALAEPRERLQAFRVLRCRCLHPDLVESGHS